MNKKNLFVFILGLLAMIKVRFLGTFAVSELLVLMGYLYVPLTFVRRNHFVQRLMLMGGLWLIGVICADLYNQTPMVNAIKGSFNVILLISLIPVIYWAVYDKPHRILYFLAGNAISCLINFYFLQSFESFFEYDVWRVYAIYPLFIFLGGFLYYVGREKWALFVTEGFALWTLFHSSRNVFLTLTISNIVLLYIGKIKEQDIIEELSQYRKQALRLIFIFAIGAYVADVTYEYGAKSGLFGEDVYNKYIMQSSSDIGIASGRMDFVMSSVLVSRNPIIGYGSYAKDENEFRVNYIWEHGGIPGKAKKSDLLPGHSFLMGAWVYSGILGGLFFMYVLYQIFIAIRRGHILYEPRLTGTYMYMTMLYVWNIFFSPFQDRLNFLFFLIPIIILNTEYTEDNDKDIDNNTLV